MMHISDIRQAFIRSKEGGKTIVFYKKGARKGRTILQQLQSRGQAPP